MNNRQYNNKIPDILKKTEELMVKCGVPIRESWKNSTETPTLPPVVFVAGEEYMLVPMDDGSVVMEIGEDCRDEKRFDPVVYLFVLYLHEESASKQRVELAARFTQIAFRFSYNKNSVKGMFFYYKMNNVQNGSRYQEAMAMALGSFNEQVADTLNKICKGIII